MRTRDCVQVQSLGRASCAVLFGASAVVRYYKPRVEVSVSVRHILASKKCHMGLGVDQKCGLRVPGYLAMTVCGSGVSLQWCWHAACFQRCPSRCHMSDKKKLNQTDLYTHVYSSGSMYSCCSWSAAKSRIACSWLLPADGRNRELVRTFSSEPGTRGPGIAWFCARCRALRQPEG